MIPDSSELRKLIHQDLGTIVPGETSSAHTLANVQTTDTIAPVTVPGACHCRSRGGCAAQGNGITTWSAANHQLPCRCHPHNFWLKVCGGLRAVYAHKFVMNGQNEDRHRSDHNNDKSERERPASWEEGGTPELVSGLFRPYLDRWQGKRPGGDRHGIELDAGGARGETGVLECDHIRQRLLQ